MIIAVQNRGVAQVARVLAWGARGRGFKSRHSDQSPGSLVVQGFFCIVVIEKFFDNRGKDDRKRKNASKFTVQS